MEAMHWERRPKLRKPALVCSFKGWNDAAESATTALSFVASRWGAERLDLEAGRLFSAMCHCRRKAPAAANFAGAPADPPTAGTPRAPQTFNPPRGAGDSRERPAA